MMKRRAISYEFGVASGGVDLEDSPLESAMSEAANSKCIRVLLLGSQPIVLSGLRLLLEAEPGICVVDDAELLRSSKRLVEDSTTSSEEVETTTQEAADVIVFDIDGGVDLLEVLAPSLQLGTPVLILSGAIDRDSLALAFRHGVTGAVRKQQPPDVLPKAVRAVHKGEIWLEQTDMELLVTELSKTPRRASQEEKRADSLTRREHQVVSLVGEGFRNVQIAERLGISDVTVRNHLTSIFRKLRLTSRFQLALYAFKYGLSKVPAKISSALPDAKSASRASRSRVS